MKLRFFRKLITHKVKNIAAAVAEAWDSGILANRLTTISITLITVRTCISN